MSIFGAPNQAFISTASKNTATATVKLGNKTTNLPVLEIENLAHTIRQQADCALDGTVHILSAAGGIATCRLSLLDCIGSCQGSENIDSALEEYRKIKDSPGEAKISVVIQSPEGDALAVFEGYVSGCTTRVGLAKDAPYVIVHITMTGVWK